MINREDYNVIEFTNGKILFHVPTNTICKLNDDFEEFFENENNKSVDILKLESKKRVIPTLKEYPDDQLCLLSFLSSSNCNLKCKYCFANDGSYNECNTRNMSQKIYRDTLHKVLEKYPNGIKTISFFGGEPLLNYNEIKDFVLYCEKIFKEKSLEPPVFSLTTNATLINDSMVEFFNNHNFSLGVSIDGHKSINDMARIHKSGNDSVYDNVIKGLTKLNIPNKKFKIAIQGTINKNHIDYYSPGMIKSWLSDMLELGVHNVGIIPVCTDNPDLKIDNLNQEVLSKIVNEYVEFWFEKLTSKEYSDVSFSIMDYIKAILFNEYKTDCAVYNQLFVNNDGDIYPCHLFYHSRSFYLGNIYEYNQQKHLKSQEYLKGCSRSNLEKCKRCISRNLCSSWCKGENMLVNGCVESIGSDIRCVVQNLVVKNIISKLVQVRESEEQYKYFRQNIMKMRY
ncbi:MAG: radical SAM protein [Paraclostridium sp.]